MKICVIGDIHGTTKWIDCYQQIIEKDNDCDKYYRYNKRLLFDEQQQEILKELDEVEQDLNTALK